jgi:hypothetical protein
MKGRIEGNKAMCKKKDGFAKSVTGISNSRYEKRKGNILFQFNMTIITFSKRM